MILRAIIILEYLSVASFAFAMLRGAHERKYGELILPNFVFVLAAILWPIVIPIISIMATAHAIEAVTKFKQEQEKE